jgi:hypothetical protein
LIIFNKYCLFINRQYLFSKFQNILGQRRILKNFVKDLVYRPLSLCKDYVAFQNLFLRKAPLAPDFKYFSKAAATNLSSNPIKTFVFQG